MSIFNRVRSTPAPTIPDAPPAAAAPAVVAPTVKPAGLVRTRASGAWVGICAAVMGGIVLIVFMLQNTRNVEVSFLWLQGSLPLALALFIAAVGAGLVAMVVGTARMSQLRQLFRHGR
jgi:uncharacterized integral membrane protein